MDYKNILTDIKNGNLKKVYLLYGNEMYLKNRIISEIKRKYIDKAFESLNMTYIDGKDTSIDAIINACETLPFMSDKKIVIVEESLFFTAKREGNTQEEEELSTYLGNLNDSTCMLFILSELKIDNRRKIVKIIKQQGDIIELSKLKGEDLIIWNQNTFSKYDKKISSGDIQYFLQLSGYYDTNANRTLYDLENEVNKICNYLGDRKTITKEDIEKGVIKSLQNNIFILVDALGQKKADIALSIFNDMLLENEPIQLILHMIIRQLRLLMMTKLLEEKGYSQGDIAQKIKVQPFIAKKLVSQTRNFTSKELYTVFDKVLHIDRSIKTGKMEWKLSLEMFIMEFSI